jgi:hypothetical protein
MPYYNYTIFEVVNGAEEEVTNYEKFLPRTWLNSNRTIVKSFASMLVNFTDPYELNKVFIVKNLGVIKENNRPPPNY